MQYIDNMKISDIDISKLTPMMQQYARIKAEAGDNLLFYRMGDFYELFFDDAITASKILDIALTKRGKAADVEIPMCGVPAHAYISYLHKIIGAGYRVAICDQMETPEEAKKRGYKAVVRREITRIITPATISEENLLDAKASNYLMSVARGKVDMAIAWLDMSTGEFCVSSIDDNILPSEITRINPSEILISDSLYDDKDMREKLRPYKTSLTIQVDSYFDAVRGEKRISAFFNINSLQSFGGLTRSQISAAGALLEYLEITQKDAMPRLNPPKLVEHSNYMSIDGASRANLELARTQHGDYKGSLLWAINRTRNAMGARLLNRYLSNPLLDVTAIENRLDSVKYLFNNSEIRQNAHSLLAALPDMERIVARICQNRGNVVDLASLRVALSQVMPMARLFSNRKSPKLLEQSCDDLGSYDKLLNLLNNAIIDEPSFKFAEGGFVRDGYSAQLDEYRHLRSDASQLQDEMVQRYRNITGISNLKIKQNNVIGMFVEINPQHIDKMGDEFIHRQTMANAVRYTTQELRSLEQKIINASSLAITLEMEIFAQIIEAIQAEADKLAITAHGFAFIDVASSLAELASEQNYNKPVISNDTKFDVVNARHAVIEQISDEFSPNNCNLSDDEKLWLITGPNMAGKSTYLRQNALIAILAQIGSYVPAEYANIGIIDKLFCRVGAADDLARGQSTFMVEMVETATILNNATHKSLVILDEIGRGTSTFDGLSIAWAVVEHLHNVTKCRTLFATHYHELTELAERLKSVACYTVEVKEWQDKIIFLYKIIAGMADKSYGINVAQLAGIPSDVLNRAKQVLALLEEDEKHHINAKLSQQLPLFTEPAQAAQKPSELEEKLANIDVDNLTPREALDMLYVLKQSI